MAKRARRKPKRSRLRRWIMRLVLAAVAVALLPFVLSLVYLAPATHPVSTLMIARAVTLQGYDRRWVPLEAMGTALPHSVMMSEDGQFCRHRGIDWGALNAVIEEALAGDKARGASTIPMQTVKNLFLWQGRSFVRKAIEAPLALYYDLVTPKHRILEIYLNIAEWGPNVFGAEAAARHHFGKSAKDLTHREAALLAVTLPNPRERDPAMPGPGLRRLAGTIEARAAKAGDYVGCLQKG